MKLIDKLRGDLLIVESEILQAQYQLDKALEWVEKSLKDLGIDEKKSDIKDVTL